MVDVDKAKYRFESSSKNPNAINQAKLSTASMQSNLINIGVKRLLIKAMENV